MSLETGVFIGFLAIPSVDSHLMRSARHALSRLANGAIHHRLLRFSGLICSSWQAWMYEDADHA